MVYAFGGGCIDVAVTHILGGVTVAAMFAKYPSLRDRVILITGGATGIGQSFVNHFVNQDARVAFMDIDSNAGEQLVQAISGDNKLPPIFVRCDVRDIDSLQSSIGRINDTIGPIAVLINNAANDERHASREITSQYWDQNMAVNLRHHFFAAQAVYPAMKAAQAGSIINLGSISWHLGMPGMPAYTAAKAAIHGLTKSLARDFGSDGIRVNEICPGAVWTEKQSVHGFDEAQLREFVTGKQSLEGVIQPDDIARMALFLASDDSRMCTGQQFVVDGGWV